MNPKPTYYKREKLAVNNTNFLLGEFDGFILVNISYINAYCLAPECFQKGFQFTIEQISCY